MENRHIPNKQQPAKPNHAKVIVNDVSISAKAA